MSNTEPENQNEIESLVSIPSIPFDFSTTGEEPYLYGGEMRSYVEDDTDDILNGDQENDVLYGEDIPSEDESILLELEIADARIKKDMADIAKLGRETRDLLTKLRAEVV